MIWSCCQVIAPRPTGARNRSFTSRSAVAPCDRRHSFAAVLWAAALSSVGLLSLAPVSTAQLTYSPGPVFTQSLDLSTVRIQFSPATRHNLFRQSDSIAIGTSGGTAIRVMKLDGTVIYNGGPTTFTG